MTDEIEEGKDEEFEFNRDEGCSFSCELPVRYGLPCRHWMYASIVEKCQLPLSLFHPRWHLDGPSVLYDRWVMTWNPELDEEGGPTLASHYTDDWYAAHGLQRAEESALAVLEKLKNMPAGMAELFANTFIKGAESLLTQQDKIHASRERFPLMLPKPLAENSNLRYRKGKKRAMTGLEVAEERERDASC